MKFEWMDGWKVWMDGWMDGGLNDKTEYGQMDGKTHEGIEKKKSPNMLLRQKKTQNIIL